MACNFWLAFLHNLEKSLLKVMKLSLFIPSRFPNLLFYIYIYIYIGIKESFSGEYLIYQFIPLHSCDYLYKISIKRDVATDEGNSRNET